MATNFIQEGNVLELTAPVGGVVSGTPYRITPTNGAGGIVVVALVTADAGAQFNAAVSGVWELPKVTLEPWSQGLLIYYNTGLLKCTSVSTTSILIGCATRTEASGTTTGYVRLNGVAEWLNQPGA